MTAFATRLRQCRELLGLSQKQLAERTEMDQSLISHYESGRRDPSIANLVRLKVALGVPYEMLLGAGSEEA